MTTTTTPDILSYFSSSSSLSPSSQFDFFHEKRKCLTNAGFLPAHGYVIQSADKVSKKAQLNISALQFVPDNLFTTIIVLLMPKQSFEEYSKHPLPLSTSLISEMDPTTVIQFYQILLLIIDAKFKLYPTPLEQDKQFLTQTQEGLKNNEQKASIKERRYLDALCVRISEKNVLTDFKMRCMMHMLGNDDDEAIDDYLGLGEQETYDFNQENDGEQYAAFEAIIENDETGSSSQSQKTVNEGNKRKRKR